MAKESAACTGSCRKKENFVAKKGKQTDYNILIYFTFAVIKSISYLKGFSVNILCTAQTVRQRSIHSDADSCQLLPRLGTKRLLSVITMWMHGHPLVSVGHWFQDLWPTPKCADAQVPWAAPPNPLWNVCYCSVFHRKSHESSGPAQVKLLFLGELAWEIVSHIWYRSYETSTQSFFFQNVKENTSEDMETLNPCALLAGM